MKLAAFSLFLLLPASAATLSVGANSPYATLSDAISAASPGDTIRVAPGTYRSCAVWTKDNLTIEGEGDGAVFADVLCQHTGIFVVNAPNATIRNITFANAASSDGNGSGLRANGRALVVDHCTFRDNQDGILTTNDPAASLHISDSVFERNGACLPNMGCAHGVYAGYIGLLRIEHSRFFESRVGHHIKSRAKRTELVGNTIEDGQDGTSSYLVDLPNGGALSMTGNTLQKGPLTQNRDAAVILGEEGDKRPPSDILVTGNSFRNDGPPTVFVRNLSKNHARLSGNHTTGPVRVLLGPGKID